MGQPALITPSRSLLVPRHGFRKPSRPMLDPADSINRGLVGCWPLGDVGGTARTADISGNNNGGTLTSITTAAALGASHHGGMALALGGTSYVSLPNTAILHNGAISVVCWVNLAALTNAYSAVFSANNNPSGVWQLFVKSTGQLAVYVMGAALLDYDGGGANTLTTSKWYCLGFSYDSKSGLTGIVNGGVDATVAANGALTNPNTTTTIGHDTANANREVNGRIEGVRQWNRALSKAEWRRLYVEPYAGIVERAPRWRVGAAAVVSSIVNRRTLGPRVGSRGHY